MYGNLCSFSMISGSQSSYTYNPQAMLLGRESVSWAWAVSKFRTPQCRSWGQNTVHMWPDLNCWMFYYNSSKHVYLFIVQPGSCSWLGSFFSTLDFWSNSCSSFLLLTVLKRHSRVNFPSKPRKCAKSLSPDTIYASSIWDAPANASCFASLKHAPSSTFCPPPLGQYKLP